MLEKLAKQIYDECVKDGEPVTMADALEMAEMELKAKNNIKMYEKSMEKPKKSEKPKVVKVSDEKKQIFNTILGVLSENYDANVQIDNKKIEILLNGKHFTVDLVENRQKKG